MLFRVLAVLIVGFAIFHYFRGSRSKVRRTQVLTFLAGGRQLSFAELSDRLGHPRWLASALAGLRSEGVIVVTMPESFDQAKAREVQIRYRLASTAAPRPF